MKELICALARAASSAADSCPSLLLLFVALLLLPMPLLDSAMLFRSFAAATETLSWNLESSAGDICDEERYCDDDDDRPDDVNRVY